VGHCLGSAIWRFLQGDDKTQMNLEQFRRHGKWLTEMRLNTFAQMGMSPHELVASFAIGERKINLPPPVSAESLLGKL